MEGRFAFNGGFRRKSKVPRSNNPRPLSGDISDFYSHDQSDLTQFLRDFNSESPLPYEDTLHAKEWEQAIGRRVCVSGVKHGILRYYGKTKFSEGTWCGVELDEPVGKNNGTVNGIQYFVARPNHGIFAPVGKVSRVEPEWSDKLDAYYSARKDHNVQSSRKVPEFPLPDQMRLLRPSSSDPSFISQQSPADFGPDGAGYFGTFLGDKRSLTEQRELSRLTKNVKTSSQTVFNYFSDNSGKYKPLPSRPANSEQTLSDSASDYPLQRKALGSCDLSYNMTTNGDRVPTLYARKSSYDTALQSDTKNPSIKQSLSFSRIAHFSYQELGSEPLSRFGDHKSSRFDEIRNNHHPVNMQQGADYRNETFPLNFFQAVEHRNDNDDDDQMSLDVDESLGILTPNQMADFTLSADPLNSCTELKTFTFPTSESFDDINDIPEDETAVGYVRNNGSHNSTSPQKSADSHSAQSHYRKDFKQDVSEPQNLTRTDALLNSSSPNIDISENAFDLPKRHKIHGLSEMLSSLKQKEVSDISFVGLKETITHRPSADSLVSAFSKVDCQIVTQSVDMEYDSRDSACLCEDSNSFPSSSSEHDQRKFDVCEQSQSPSQFAEDVTIRKYYDIDSSRDSLLQGDQEQIMSKEKQLTVSWEDCIERDNDGVFTKVERPESVYTVGSNDTGYQEDGEFDTEMGTSTESNEIGKRFSTLSRDSCLVSEDLDKVTESTSTSGYSTGLSDSYCTDRVEDEMIKQPNDSFHESAARDGRFYCCQTKSRFINDEVDHHLSHNIETDDKEDLGISASTSAFHDLTSDDTISCIDNTLIACPETSPDDTNGSQVNGDSEDSVILEKTLPADSEEPTLSKIQEIAGENMGENDNTADACKNSSEKLISDCPKEDQDHLDKSSNQVQPKPVRNGSCTVETPNSKTKNDDDRKKQLAKTPKRNVMSKIKAMIEATSCKTIGRNKMVEAPESSEKKVAVAHKKSRWEAVTSKIAASLAEEKSKPKAKREIKSKVNTNLSMARQHRTCRSPRLDSDRNSEAEGESVSSISSKEIGEKKSASSASQKQEHRKTPSRSRDKSPRPGGKTCFSSRSTSPVTASESSAAVSLTSHHSKARTPLWKGSTSTVASSIPPPQVKTKPPAAATPPIKANITTVRTPQKPPQRRTTATAKKNQLTAGHIRVKVDPPCETNTSLTKDGRQKSNSSVKEHGGSVRVLHHPLPKPVRPPMWLSKAELSQEIQHLGTLCESRTKELNLLKMKLKHATLGFDAFAAVFKYLTQDLDALSHPQLVKELAKTQKLLQNAKSDIVCYEEKIKELKTYHDEELAELSQKMLQMYQSELQQVTSKQNEEMKLLEEQYQKKMSILENSFMGLKEKAKTEQEKEVDVLNQHFLKQKEEAELLHQSEMKHLEESHLEVQKSLKAEIEQLKGQYHESKQQSKNIEETLQKDTDSKLQWISCKKTDLDKEVDSLKAVLEMKNNELHSLRKENLEMQKELEELPIAKEKIKMLQARAEDLQALMAEKVRVERQLSTEHNTMKEVYERESKMNKSLLMENEELQYRIKQTAELSLFLRSQTNSPDVPESPSPPKSPWQQCNTQSRSNFFISADPLECDPEVLPAESPGPTTAMQSKFFTFVDPAESPHSPRYKRVQPSLASSPHRQIVMKIPGKTFLTSTPRKAKVTAEGHSAGGTPRKMSKNHCGKEPNAMSTVGVQVENPDVVDSMAEYPEPNEVSHLPEVQKVLNCDSTTKETEEKNVECAQVVSDNVPILGDPKKYYHMAFPVLKETGTDCDTDEGGSYLLAGTNESRFLAPKETDTAVEDVTRNGYVDSQELQGGLQNTNSHKTEFNVSQPVGRIINGPCTNSDETGVNLQADEYNIDCFIESEAFVSLDEREHSETMDVNT